MTQASPASVPLPPPDATRRIICCEYCPVACGYQVYSWPVDRAGGPAAADNAFGVDFPVAPLSGRWISQNMHTVTNVDGKLSHVVIIPDADIGAVNVGGTHSVRGGALAQKLYTPQGPTSDRYQFPMLNIRGDFVPIPWEVATELVARLSQHTLDNYGELAWGMKIYSYQFFENTFAASKLALKEIGTPNFSPHHAPAEGDDTPGLSDVGIDAFSASFEDDKAADVLFIAGSDPYETKTVRFTTWQAPGEATIIYVDPRRTFTAAYAESRGGLHLQLLPGTDTALYSAIAREIIAQGWEDTSFIRDHTASRAELDAEGKWRRKMFGGTFDEMREYLFSQQDFSLEGVEQATGVPADKVRRAAELMTGGGAAERPKTTILIEKGVYWSHNYENTAAIGNLALVTGSTGREGRAVSRMGGHQRGGVKAAGYPLDKSPHEFEGHKLEMDTERWFAEGNTRFRWIVGQNWIGAMGASHALADAAARLTSMGPPVVSPDPDRAFDALARRMDEGGTVIVHQEIYPNDSVQYADIILAAGAWGEDTYARANAERRIRLYEKIADPPGQAMSDWKIFAAVGRAMGFSGFDWADTNEIFEESGPRSAGSRKDYAALVEKAQTDGIRGHDLLKSFGNTGIQAPIGIDASGNLTETPRLHADLKFKSDSGKANFILADWEAVKRRNEILGPIGDELWVTNGRVNELWNNLSDYVRREIATARWPMNWLEISPADASARGIESGDLVSIESDNVLDQLGNVTSGSFTAAAYVSDIVPDGVTFTYFLYPGQPANTVVSGDSSLQPLNLRYNFKLGKGRVRKIGTTDLASRMSFAPRNLTPA